MLTTDNFESAHHTSKILVTEKLAACCNILPNAISIYGWKGAIQESHEYVIIIKTKKAVLNDLEQRIKEMHTYEVPEIISLPIESGYAPYLKWLNDSLNEGI